MIFTDQHGRRLEVTKRHRELQGMNDHDLLVQLHERMDNHLADHRSVAVRNHWLVASLIGVIGAILSAGLLVRP